MKSAKSSVPNGAAGIRVSVSKSVRFEVFARDEFACQYCGRRPPEVVLELDHVNPVSRGGNNDLINLVTSCFDCNRGKAAKTLSHVAPRPDADLAFLKVQQELAEVKRFLTAKKKRDRAIKELCDALRDAWLEKLTECVPSDRILIPWINIYGPEEIEAAIVCAIPAYMQHRFGYDENSAFNKLLPWVGGILRNRAREKQEMVQ